MARVIENVLLNSTIGNGNVALCGNGFNDTVAVQPPTSYLSCVRHLSMYPETVGERLSAIAAIPAGRPGCFAGVFRCRGFARFASPAIQHRWPTQLETVETTRYHHGTTTMATPGSDRLQGLTRIPPQSWFAKQPAKQAELLPAAKKDSGNSSDDRLDTGINGPIAGKTQSTMGGK